MITLASSVRELHFRGYSDRRGCSKYLRISQILRTLDKGRPMASLDYPLLSLPPLRNPPLTSSLSHSKREGNMTTTPYPNKSLTHSPLHIRTKALHTFTHLRSRQVLLYCGYYLPWIPLVSLRKYLKPSSGVGYVLQ